MRLRALVLAALLGVALGDEGAAHVIPLNRPSVAAERQLVIEAAFVCGTFDGKFTCRNVPGGAQYGKNATPGARTWTPDSAPGAITGGSAQDATDVSGTGTTGQAAPDGTTCQTGMVGTPPNCSCPKNSELLGGNCVHYTATTCSNGLSADSLPQPCGGVDEKLSCKLREDGLKDCCCLLYDRM